MKLKSLGRWRLRFGVLGVLCAVGLTPCAALAHGPCGTDKESCLRPDRGPSGTPVNASIKAVLSLWNPRPNLLALGVPGTSKVCGIRCAATKPIYHSNSPMVLLDQAPKPSPIQFDVPDVAPGKYLVVMYDGSEGGLHYTWEEFEVTADPGSSQDRGTSEASSLRWLLAVVLVLVGAGAGWLLGIRR